MSGLNMEPERKDSRLRTIRLECKFFHLFVDYGKSESKEMEDDGLRTSLGMDDDGLRTSLGSWDGG